MNKNQNRPISRRDFLKDTGRLATVSALAGVTIPYVHAAGSDLVQVALIGCGGRGTGAAGQALSTTSGPIKLVAMADVFEHRLTASFDLAAHTGQIITYDDMLNCEHEFAPGLDQLTNDSPAPLVADTGGKYPVPQPGIVTKREY